jgi:hypothetical protein
VEKQEEFAALMHQLKELGLNIGQCCVLPEGVFFPSETSASLFSERHGKDLVKVDGLVSGWLVKNKK